MFEDWYSILKPSFEQGGVIFLRFLVAILVFIVGYLISVAIGKLVAGLLEKLKFNRLFEKGGWQKALKRAEIKVDPSGFIGAIFKWIFVIVSLLLAVDILKLTQFGKLLASVIDYLPHVVVAVLIFIVAVIIADILEKLTRVAVEGINAGYASLTGTIVKWAIWILAVFAILEQLDVAADLVHILQVGIVYGIVATISIAAGIAFGLGGRTVAAELLTSLRDKFKKE